MELTFVPEIIAKAVGAIAISNGRITIYLYDEQMPLDGVSGAQRVVTGKIVGELTDLPAAIGKLAMCFAAEQLMNVVRSPPGPSKPHLVV